MLNFGLAILGGYLADYHFGKYWTIALGLFVNAIGTIMLTTIVRLVDVHDYDISAGVYSGVSLTGFSLAALGDAIATPTLGTFVAEQLCIIAPDSNMASFYRWFYVTYNVGSLVAGVVAPILGQDVSYFACYLFMAVAGVLAVGVFLAGRPFYVLPGDKSANQMTEPLLGDSSQRSSTALSSTINSVAASAGEDRQQALTPADWRALRQVAKVRNQPEVSAQATCERPVLTGYPRPTYPVPPALVPYPRRGTRLTSTCPLTDLNSPLPPPSTRCWRPFPCSGRCFSTSTAYGHSLPSTWTAP